MMRWWCGRALGAGACCRVHFYLVVFGLAAIIVGFAIEGASAVPNVNLQADFSCTHVLTRLMCFDSTKYAAREDINRIEWYVNGALVSVNQPSDWAIIPVGDNWFDWGEANATVGMRVVFNDQFFTGPFVTKAVTLNNWSKFLFLSFLVLGFLGAFQIMKTRLWTHYPRVPPAFRSKAVGERPGEDVPGFRSYRYMSPNDITHPQTRKVPHNGSWLWVTYSTRPASLGERSYHGKKYVGEVATIRERIT